MKCLILIVVLLVTSCSTINQVLGVAGSVNDKALIASETTICKVASVASVLRRYNTPEKARAWLELCVDKDIAPPVIFSGVLKNGTN